MELAQNGHEHVPRNMPKTETMRVELEQVLVGGEYFTAVIPDSAQKMYKHILKFFSKSLGSRKLSSSLHSLFLGILFLISFGIYKFPSYWCVREGHITGDSTIIYQNPATSSFPPPPKKKP